MNTIKINAKVAKMIAHRGVSGIERENTCPAFVAAGNDFLKTYPVRFLRQKVLGRYI